MKGVSGEPEALPASSGVAEVDAERQRWRASLLQGVLTTTAIAAAIAATFAGFSDIFRWSAAPVVVIAVCIAFLALSKRLPFRVRSIGMLGGIYVACTVAMAASGAFAPNALVLMSAVTVMAAVLLGRSAAFVMLGLAIGAIVGTALLHSAGVLSRPAAWYAPLDAASWPVTARIALIFAAATLTLFTGVSMLLARTERLLADKAAALDAAECERAEKERMRRDLDAREDAFRKAREIELIGRLAGCAAHDINNALTVISGYAGLLRRAQGNLPLLAEALTAIDEAVGSASTTTRDLRALGPQARGPAVALALSEHVERAALMFQRLFPANIAVRVTTAPGLPPIEADESAIQRTITNLALNARDAMREGGTLELRVRSAHEGEPEGAGGQFIVLEVEDTGTGMDQTTLGRIFEPFFTTKGASGTGLGLSSVRELVTDLGGQLTVQSEVGKGTCFFVYWPVAAPAKPAHSSARPALQRGSGRVLVVDDDQRVRAVMTRALAEQGYAVAEAADVKEALALVDDPSRSVSVLVTDCAMPGPPVRELIAAFRAHVPEGRVLMCTGYAAEEASIPESAVDGFLPKPFTGDALVRAVAAIQSGSK